MIQYTMGEDVASGADVFVDENNGLLYMVRADETEYDAAIRTGKSACANGEPPKRKSFREFLDEKYGGSFGDEISVHGSHWVIMSIVEGMSDYMDYISGSEPEAESSSFCLACGKFFNDVVSKVCPGCGSGHFTDLSEPEAEPEPPTTEDHAEICVDLNCKGCGKPQEPKEPELDRMPDISLFVEIKKITQNMKAACERAVAEINAFLKKSREVKEPESSGMTFMEAVAAMRDGKKVRRKAWQDWMYLHCSEGRYGAIWYGKQSVFQNPGCEDSETSDWEVV